RARTPLPARSRRGAPPSAKNSDPAVEAWTEGAWVRTVPSSWSPASTPWVLRTSACRCLEVVDEPLHLDPPRLIVCGAEDGGRMHRRHDDRRQRRLDALTSLTRHPEALSEQRLSGRCSETDEHTRFDERDLDVDPGAAGGDLRRVRLRVDAALAARLPLEV